MLFSLQNVISDPNFMPKKKCFKTYSEWGPTLARWSSSSHLWRSERGLPGTLAGAPREPTLPDTRSRWACPGGTPPPHRCCPLLTHCRPRRWLSNRWTPGVMETDKDTEPYTSASERSCWWTWLRYDRLTTSTKLCHESAIYPLLGDCRSLCTHLGTYNKYYCWKHFHNEICACPNLPCWLRCGKSWLSK